MTKELALEKVKEAHAKFRRGDSQGALDILNEAIGLMESSGFRSQSAYQLRAMLTLSIGMSE